MKWINNKGEELSFPLLKLLGLLAFAGFAGIISGLSWAWQPDTYVVAVAFLSGMLTGFLIFAGIVAWNAKA